jgi:hypothetical protein
MEEEATALPFHLIDFTEQGASNGEVLRFPAG